MIMENPLFLILLPILLYPAILLVKRKGYTRKITFLHMIIMSTLILAAASPAIIEEKQVEAQEEMQILVDNSTSMKTLYKPDEIEEKKKRISTEDDNSRIFSTASRLISENSSNLLVTDGRTNQKTDTLIQAAKNKNASISILRLQERPETALRIEGPSTTVPNAENKFKVKLSKTVEKPVQVNIQGTEVETIDKKINESYSFTKKFNSKGTFKIKATAKTSDEVFKQNNKFYKTVKVREKPDILVIGERGKLEAKLEKFYNVENREKIPENVEKYYTTIMKEQKPLENDLEKFLIEGNGLIYTGSYEEEVSDLLPVEKGRKSEEDTGAKIILLIDSSFGTGKCVKSVEEVCLETSSKGGNAKQSIQLAYKLVEELKKNNKVGVVAYNDEAHLISEPKSLASNKKQLKQLISRISPSGPSFHHKGVKGAAKLARENDTIVMLTDGKIGEYERNKRVPSKIKEEASNMEAELITVGIGKQANEPMLEKTAENTGGYYLENSETGRLKFQFGAGGGNTEYTPTAVVNPNHFITNNIELKTSLRNFEPVKTKRNAQKLVAGSNGKPVLSTWRYGLGRIAAFSAGNQNMGRTLKTDPSLVSRTVSWTVGNPYRKQENWTNVEDSLKPEKPTAKSSKPLNGLTKESKNLYTGKIKPGKKGFNEWKNQLYAYNYNEEIQKIGQNMEKLEKIPEETNGKIINPQEINQIEQETRTRTKTVQDKTKLSPYLIAIALITFLAEVGYRKSKGKL